MKYALAFALLFSSCSADCPNDAFCPAGMRCVHTAFVGEQGSACVVLCNSNGSCPPNTGSCTGCPESPLRCTLDDRTPSGGMCCKPGTRCF